MPGIHLYYLYYFNKNLKNSILLYLIYLASRVEGRKERSMWPLLRPCGNCPCQTSLSLSSLPLYLWFPHLFLHIAFLYLSIYLFVWIPSSPFSFFILFHFSVIDKTGPLRAIGSHWFTLNCGPGCPIPFFICSLFLSLPNQWLWIWRQDIHLKCC